MLKYLLTIPTLIYICTIFHSFFKIKDIDSVTGTHLVSSVISTVKEYIPNPVRYQRKK